MVLKLCKWQKENLSIIPCCGKILLYLNTIFMRNVLSD